LGKHFAYNLPKDNDVKLTITTLSENTAAIPPLLGEQGLSILVDTGSNAFLLDTGQSISVSHNVDALGVDLDRIDKIVLSHGHFDHTGGLRALLQKMKRKIDIVAHPDVWSAKYNIYENHPPKYIGIPFQPAELEGLGARFTLSRGPVVLTDGVMTTGEVPMTTGYETIDPHLYVKEGDEFKPDPVMDDRGIVIKTGKGLVVVLGCAHRGMINTLYHAQELTGIQDIELVVGGSHLIGSSEERIWQTIAALKVLRVRRMGLCHCTSLPVEAILAQEFGEGFFFNSTGSRIEIE
jgi:7,8-dihydropterin-6-yl-methyl-4-(beta-D-ribofuranosyl)aminobenzene 5'-phosphate synthase